MREKQETFTYVTWDKMFMVFFTCLSFLILFARATVSVVIVVTVIIVVVVVVVIWHSEAAAAVKAYTDENALCFVAATSKLVILLHKYRALSEQATEVERKKELAHAPNERTNEWRTCSVYTYMVYIICIIDLCRN